MKEIKAFKNFNEFWREIVKRHPAKPCLEENEGLCRKLSYEQLNDCVDRTAYLLEKEGLHKTDRFAVLTENCLEFFFLYLASMKMGTLIVPVTPTLPEPEQSAILERFKPVLIFADALRMGMAAAHKNSKSFIRKIFSLDTECENKNENFNIIIQSLTGKSAKYDKVNLSDPGSLYCSSGTTGRPKGIPQSPLNLLTAAESLARAYGFEDKDTQMGVLPVYHTALATYGFWPGVFCGSNFVLCRKFSRNNFWKDIERYKIAFVETVPTILSMLMNPPEEVNKYDLSSLKFIGSGSGPLSIAVWEKFENTFNVRIAQKYGLSETEPTHFNPPEPGRRRMGSIGKALDMCQVKIVDDKDSELENGRIGEIIMRGDNIVDGYFNDRQETDNVFRSGWFYSGDLAYKDEQGFFFLAGRKKELIIRGGVNIYPAEIDNVLNSHPEVINAVSFAISDEIYHEEIGAAVKLKPESKISADEVMRYCRNHLGEHKCPKKIFFLDEIPMTASGKPIRRKLSEMFNN